MGGFVSVYANYARFGLEMWSCCKSTEVVSKGGRRRDVGRVQDGGGRVVSKANTCERENVDMSNEARHVYPADVPEAPSEIECLEE